MRYIAFDFDGTIADSNFAICEAMERACIRHGVTYIGDSEFTQYIGQDLNVCIQKSTGVTLPQEKLDGIARSYRETFKYELVKPFLGIEEVLSECKASGDVLSISTSRRRKSLTFLLQNFKFNKYFDFAVCGDEVEHPKPHIDTLNTVAKNFGCMSNELMVIGDTTWDIDMTNNVGGIAIGVTWGSHSESALLDAGASLTVDTPEELQKYFAGQL